MVSQSRRNEGTWHSRLLRCDCSADPVFSRSASCQTIPSIIPASASTTPILFHGDASSMDMALTTVIGGLTFAIFTVVAACALIETVRYA